MVFVFKLTFDRLYSRKFNSQNLSFVITVNNPEAITGLKSSF